ncbi:MAG: alkaline phosphatase D family protein [Burkholderiaceae bacterium]
MKLRAVLSCTLLGLLTACQSIPTTGLVNPIGRGKAIGSSESGESTARGMPRAPTGKKLPLSGQLVSTILMASCMNEEARQPAKVLYAMSRESADLLLMTGDNVYGDISQGRYVSPDTNLSELRLSFAQLAARADFRALRAKHPMMVAWDDHDYGANGAGREFAHKLMAERLHEHFWGLDRSEAGKRAGTYYARTFGPAGNRVQIIMLDTRFFRSPLTEAASRSAKGKLRYRPSTAPDQDMLGQQQWAWLAGRLRTGADVNLIVSSIQVLPRGQSSFESWGLLPAEQSRLLAMVNQSGAKGPVFVSGDRHRGFLFRSSAVDGSHFIEVTASAINRQSKATKKSADPALIGEPFPDYNYGRLQIEWDEGLINIEIRDEAATVVRSMRQRFRPPR